MHSLGSSGTFAARALPGGPAAPAGVGLVPLLGRKIRTTSLTLSRMFPGSTSSLCLPLKPTPPCPLAAPLPSPAWALPGLPHPPAGPWVLLSCWVLGVWDELPWLGRGGGHVLNC